MVVLLRRKEQTGAPALWLTPASVGQCIAAQHGRSRRSYIESRAAGIFSKTLGRPHPQPSLGLTPEYRQHKRELTASLLASGHATALIYSI